MERIITAAGVRAAWRSMSGEEHIVLQKMAWTVRRGGSKRGAEWIQTQDDAMTVAAEAWLRMRKQADAAQMEIMLRMESCKIQKAKLLREMAQQYQGGPFEQTLNACAAQIICGGEVIPLPKSPYALHTAGEIGKALGITANHVGRIANQYGLKKSEYGEWVLDVAAHSAKTVRTFRYYESVIPIIKDKLREEGRL